MTNTNQYTGQGKGGFDDKQKGDQKNKEQGDNRAGQAKPDVNAKGSEGNKQGNREGSQGGRESSM